MSRHDDPKKYIIKPFGSKSVSPLLGALNAQRVFSLTDTTYLSEIK